jgi:hypothetical protein
MTPSKLSNLLDPFVDRILDSRDEGRIARLYIERVLQEISWGWHEPGMRPGREDVICPFGCVGAEIKQHGEESTCLGHTGGPEDDPNHVWLRCNCLGCGRAFQKEWKWCEKRACYSADRVLLKGQPICYERYKNDPRPSDPPPGSSLLSESGRSIETWHENSRGASMSPEDIEAFKQALPAEHCLFCKGVLGISSQCGSHRYHTDAAFRARVDAPRPDEAMGEFRRLDSPMIIAPGVPVGLKEKP